MDIEFHYYINYLIAAEAGFSDRISQKIAYSAQYLDDNTEAYSIIEKDAKQYNNLITQSYNPLLKPKEILEIFPIFHFIPGNDPVKSSLLRRDGSLRYMSTLPNNKLARGNLIEALKSSNPYWIGIASHSFVDTWAHQNFTGLKDSYNSLHQRQDTKSLKLPGQIGHAEVLNLPDTPNIHWYDFRLKEMKIDNNKRMLEAAKELFKLYIKYGGGLLERRAQEPKKIWQNFFRQIKGLLYGEKKILKEIEFFQDKKKSSQMIIQILGLKKQQRIDCYNRLAEMKGIEPVKYNKRTWLEEAVTTDNNLVANDLNQPEIKLEGLADSGISYYAGPKDNDGFKKTIANLMNFYQAVYFWQKDKKETNWYLFQEAAKKQKNYLFDKIISLAEKDKVKMQADNY